MQVALEDIDWNIDDNPREDVDLEDVEELKASIKSTFKQRDNTERALLEPIGIVPAKALFTVEKLAEQEDVGKRTIYRWADEGKYARVSLDDELYLMECGDEPCFKICYGWRRYKAMESLSEEYDWAKTIEAVVESPTQADDTLQIFALIENVHREDMTPIEEAEAVSKLLENYEDTDQKEVSEYLSKSEAWVSQRLQLLEFEGDIQDRIERMDLPVSYLRQVMRLDDPDLIGEVLDLIETRDVTHTDVKNAVDARKIGTDPSDNNDSGDTRKSNQEKNTPDTSTQNKDTSSDEQTDPTSLDREPNQSSQTEGLNVQDSSENMSPSRVIEEINMFLRTFEKRKSRIDDDKYAREMLFYKGGLAAMYYLLGELDQYPFTKNEDRDSFMDDPKEYIDDE